MALAPDWSSGPRCATTPFVKTGLTSLLSTLQWAALCCAVTLARAAPTPADPPVKVSQPEPVEVSS